MKKLIIIISAVLILFIAYLVVVNYTIYQRISKVGLTMPDTQGEYIIDNQQKEQARFGYSALGDSLTAGVGVASYKDSFPFKLAQKLAVNHGSVVLYDRAYPGARTSDLLKNLLPAAIKDQPAIITLLIGVNDIHGRVSKIEFAKNYAEILGQLKTKTRAKIFAISIPYLGTDSLLWPPFNWYFKDQTIAYNKIIKKLAAENNIQYIDLYTPTAEMFKNPVWVATDLFHPSAKGYNLWTEIIYANFNN
ncbi:MAG: SGNH/GDSL hydrolase family protein [Candidatus Buchananbacteria bacterium]